MYQVLFAIPNEDGDALVCVRTAAPGALAAIRDVHRHYPQAKIRQVFAVRKRAA